MPRPTSGPDIEIAKAGGVAQHTRAGLGMAIVISGVSQAISSLTNFAILLYLVRAMEKSGFGLYSFGFACVLLLAGLVTASIAVQFVVNLPDQLPDSRTLYAANHVVAIVAVGSGAAVLAAAFGIVLSATGLVSGQIAGLVLTVAFAAATYGWRDLLVRFAFSERRELIVLCSNFGVAVGVSVALALIALFGQNLDAPLALMAYGIGQVAGGGVALHMLRLPMRSVRMDGVRSAFRDSWTGGRWAMLTSFLYHVRTQSHSFVVGPLLGPAALAELHASRVLVTPAVMAVPPLNQVLMPRLAEARRKSQVLMRRTATRAIALQVGIAVAYCAVLMPILPVVVPRVLGESYLHVGSLVLAWSAVVLLMSLRSGLTLVLESAGQFRDLSLLNLRIAAITIALVLVFTWMLGALGAIVGVGISEFLLCMGLYSLLKIKTHQTASFERPSGG